MAASSVGASKKPYGKTMIFGIVSVALYAALLINQDSVTAYFSKGGVYAFLPIIMAFIFSFVHGNFTGYFWTSLGVEASKKKKEGN
ncbi:MAG: hypothetical protein EPN22_12630 [Nitrospirae bacterium]|nr:MAG: hypothetical protein EPN22_12630 [Nitrospirota bacterium]